MVSPSTTFLTLTTLVLSATAQLTTSQIESVFGQGATGLTGNSVKLPVFTFSAVLNATHALISLNQSAPATSVGWMGSGVGTAMANADFLVGWPTQQAQATGSAPAFTISHRQSTGEFMPTVVSMAAGLTTTSFFTFLPSLSSKLSDPYTAYSFIRPLSMPSNYPTTSTYKAITKGEQNFIYASSTVKPGSTDEAATLTQHDQAHANFMLDLSVPITLAAAPSSGSGSGSTGAVPSSGSSSPGRPKRDMYLIAHATVGSLALAIVAPAAILIGRFMRNSTWFPAHAALNLLAAAMIVATFALGYTQVGDDHFDDTHTRLGLAIFILVLLQVIFGAVSHRVKHNINHSATFPTLAQKSPLRLVHIFTGIIIIILGYIQIPLGFTEWNENSSGGTSVPMGAKIVFYIVLALTALAYIGGWAKEGMMKKRGNGGYGVEKVHSGTTNAGTP